MEKPKLSGMTLSDRDTTHANFYEHVGRFAKVFFELERSAFEMCDAGTGQVKRASNAPPESPGRRLN